MMIEGSEEKKVSDKSAINLKEFDGSELVKFGERNDEKVVNEETGQISGPVEAGVEVPLTKPENCCFKLKSAATGCLRHYWKGLIAILVLYLIGTLCSTLLKDEVESAIEYFHDNQVLGSFLYTLTYTIVIQIGVPSTLMEIAAAFLFDEFWQIFLINTLAKNVGRAVGFAIGKYLIYNWVKKNLLSDTQPLTRALANLIKREPMKYSTLWSLAYVPTWSHNYGMPVLGCSFWVFMVSGNISGIPYSVMWTFVGITARDTIEDVQSGNSVNPSQLAATVIGVVFLFVTVGMLGYYVNKELKRIEREEGSHESAEVEERNNGVQDAEQPQVSVHPKTQISL